MTTPNDPANDPVGTVRRDQQGRLFIRTDEAPPAQWVIVFGPSLLPMWQTAQRLADSTVIGVVPGTPAAENATPADAHSAVQTALWDTAEHEGIRFTPGTLERLATAAVTAIAHNGAELEQRLDVASDVIDTTRRNLRTPDGSSLHMHAGRVMLELDKARAELEQWRSGQRTQQGTAADLFDLAKARGDEITHLNRQISTIKEHYQHRCDTLTAARDRAQESRQAWAIEADRLDQENDHLRADLARALDTITSNTGSVFGAADRAFRAWTAGTDETWPDHLAAVPDATGRWVRVAEAVLADPLAPGTRVRIGKCHGTVERAPRRVRVRLDGAAPATFDARFVHPVTTEEG